MRVLGIHPARVNGCRVQGTGGKHRARHRWQAWGFKPSARPAAYEPAHSVAARVQTRLEQSKQKTELAKVTTELDMTAKALKDAKQRFGALQVQHRKKELEYEKLQNHLRDLLCEKVHPSERFWTIGNGSLFKARGTNVPDQINVRVCAHALHLDSRERG